MTLSLYENMRAYNEDQYLYNTAAKLTQRQPLK